MLNVRACVCVAGAGRKHTGTPTNNCFGLSLDGITLLSLQGPGETGT